MDFRSLDPHNPEHARFGFQLMIALLVRRLGGNVSFTEQEIRDVVTDGRFARVAKSEDGKALTFKIQTQREQDDETEKEVRELLLSVGLPPELVDEAVREVRADVERERLEQQFKL